MKHILAVLLITACAYSIKVRHDNFLASRPAIARVHAAKVRELKAELERKQSDDSHKKMADECVDFITKQREEWFRKTEEFALLSNGVIGITLLYLGMTYLKRKEKTPNKGMKDIF